MASIQALKQNFRNNPLGVSLSLVITTVLTFAVILCVIVLLGVIPKNTRILNIGLLLIQTSFIVTVFYSLVKKTNIYIQIPFYFALGTYMLSIITKNFLYNNEGYALLITLSLGFLIVGLTNYLIFYIKDNKAILKRPF